jgi:hypothetical protein
MAVVQEKFEIDLQAEETEFCLVHQFLDLAGVMDYDVSKHLIFSL